MTTGYAGGNCKEEPASQHSHGHCDHMPSLYVP